MPIPTNTPSSAPDQTPKNARDEASPEAVLNDEDLDDTPGGGGLGGAAAADPLSGSARNGGGTTRNSAIDIGVVPPGDVAEGADGAAARDARVQTTESDVAEPKPVSQ